MNRPTMNLRGSHAVPVRSVLTLTLILIATCLGVVAARQKVSAHGLIRTTVQTTTQAKGQTTGATSVPQTGPRSPSDTVREFYKALREKRFKEAFALSIYRPALEGLKPQEYDDLRPDFERVAAAVGQGIPVQLEISGEQISADSADVFVKMMDAEGKPKIEPVGLIKSDGRWIVGDRENQVLVKKAGKKFFFNARIDAHHAEVQDLFTHISLALLLYSQQHNGLFADLPTLIAAGMVPKDLEATDSTGYRFNIYLADGGKRWSATAEPAQYGRTGRLSFFMDAAGVRSADVGGKRLSLPKKQAN